MGLSDEEFKKRDEELRAAEVARGEVAWWWLSFADAGGFRGAVVLQAVGFVHALGASHDLGSNPGGEVQGMKLPRPRNVETRAICETVFAAHAGRLMNREQCEAFDLELAEFADAAEADLARAAASIAPPHARKPGR